MRLAAIYSMIFLFSATVCIAQPKAPTPQVAKPILLVGRPNDLAINVIKEFSSEPKKHANQIQRTKVILGFKAGTTVAQINNLIVSINGTLVRTYEKSPILEIIIPTSARSDDTLQRLRKHPLVDFAMLQLDPPRT